MVSIVLLVLALFVLQTLLPGRFRQAPAPGGQVKLSNQLGESLGNRDHMRPLTNTGERAARALGNMQEALPVFLALALMNMIVAPNAAQAITGAWIFLVARAVYLLLYITGVPVVRTIVWAVGWVGLAMMIPPLL
jgi:uncharacterized MAPEG superfamily protein